MNRPRFSIPLAAFGIAAAVSSLLPSSAAETATGLGIFGGMADLAADNDGALHLIWMEGGTLYYGRIEGMAVAGQQQAASGVNSGEFRPRISVRPDGGSVHVCWVNGPHDVLSHSWLDADGSWRQETVWGQSGDMVYYYPACAVGLDETTHLICGQAQRDHPSQQFYARKPVDGGWTAPVAVSPAPTGIDDFRDTSMIVDFEGGIHARWSTFNDLVRYRYAPPGLGLEDSPTELVPALPDGNSNGEGDIFVEGNAAVHLSIWSWTSGSLNNVDHSYKPRGGEFSAPTRASLDHVENINVPAVGVDRDGKTYISWEQMFYNTDGTFNHGEVKLSVFEAGAWTISTIDPAAGEMNRCKTSIAVTDAAVYLMWKNGAGEWVIEDFPPEAPPEEEGMENPAEETAPEISWPDETGHPDAPDGTAAPDADASQDPSGEPPAESETTGGCGCRLAR